MRKNSGLPQLKEISFKKAITVRGGVSISCIYYNLFKSPLSHFFQIPSPYEGSQMQISCGIPEKRSFIHVGDEEESF